MEPHILFCASIILTIPFSLATLPKSYSQEHDWYKDCEPAFNCGTLNSLYYPFWSENLRPSYCGRKEFQLHCQENEFPSIWIGPQTFVVKEIDLHLNAMKIVQADLAYDDCSSNLTDTSLSDGTQFSLFSYGEDVKNVTLFYDCPSNISGLRNFTCQAPSKHRVYYVDENKDDGSLQQLHELQQCGHRILVPISDGQRLDAGGIDALIGYLNQGFRVNYENVDQPHCIDCWHAGGICGSATNNTSQFTCYCKDGTHDSVCNGSHGTVMVGALAAPLICVILSCCIIKFWTTTKVDNEIEAFIRNHGPLALTRYKFSDVKKMTKSFKVKLGQGGYGTVYKGKLPDGCSVAVKMLTSSKENGQEFINEVASISRTSHVNIVSLLGFCLEGRKKALIYEFMPNGSLDKFVNKIDETNVSLSWENLYQIALGTARGLEYLHRGCNTRILHFDIKPHNILLDESFCPKISDFGLAKICPKKESIISISDPRGTIGYLAPEVWNRNIGGVSHKSDVYSYGMLLLDMAGGRQKLNNETNCTTEIYFPDWIYDRLKQDCNLGHDEITTVEEHVFAKKMTIVGLWCIQTFPSHRPTMSRVIEMLEGSLDSLEMPPRPVMSSSTRIEQESSTTSTY